MALNLFLCALTVGSAVHGYITYIHRASPLLALASQIQALVIGAFFAPNSTFSSFSELIPCHGI